MSFVTGLLAQFALRRIMEVGGIVGSFLVVLLKTWNELPPPMQDTILKVLEGHWQEIALGTLVPLVIALWGYVWSAISTFSPHIAIDGKQAPLRRIADDKRTFVEEAGRTAIGKRQSLAELLGSMFKR